MKKIDLTNQTYGELTVLQEVEPHIKPSGKKSRQWLCKCSCGRTTIVSMDNLRSGHTTSCGCKRGDFDHTGERFGRLIAIERLLGAYRCKCDCGNIITVTTCNLTSGNTKSCGCYQKDQTSLASFKSLIGNKYGLLTVLERVNNNRFGHVCYLCQCECGGKTIVDAANLRQGITNSCGCLKSKGEMIINNWLVAHNINFQSQYSFENCVLESGRRPFFDFAIFKNQKLYCLIEYDGKQHFKVTGGWNDEENFKLTKFRDEQKNKWCKENNILLYRISYLDNIEEKLKEYLLGDNFYECG